MCGFNCFEIDIVWCDYLVRGGNFWTFWKIVFIASGSLKSCVYSTID